ncbi:hypothetical protein Tco_0401393 [Tanacetum coccineum]
MGLDKNVYGTTRSNILGQVPLPNVNKVYSTLIQEEQVKTMTRDKDDRPQIMALAMQNLKLRISHFLVHIAIKHTEENCFEINGYPEWRGERPRVDRKGGSYEKGASHHMKSMIEELSNLKEIVQCTLELPDGNIDEGNCIFKFAPNICVIHDLTSRTVIGAGERRDGGLFYFWGCANNLSVKDDNNKSCFF